MDNDCGSFVAANGVAAVNNCTNCTKGALSQAELDAAVSHLFRLRLRLGYFDPPHIAPYANASYTTVNYSAHFAKALQARAGTPPLAFDF
jgi:beta-glucosidase-like glycosyl hydrolase